MVINKRNTILLVEDDELFSILNKESLLKCGYNVLTAKSAEESIKLTYNNHFDLILMDIDLGEEIDGIQTAKSILDIRDIPIIFFLITFKSRNSPKSGRNIFIWIYT